MSSLKTNYKDAVWSGDRRVRITPDGGTAYEGTIRDITSYDEAGDVFGAADINATNAQVNANADKINRGGDLVESTAFTYEPNFTAYGSGERTLPYAAKTGRVVELYGSFKPTKAISSTTGNGVLMGHVPTGFEPYRVVQAVQNGPEQTKFLLVITTDGGIWVSRMNTSGTSVAANQALRIGCTYISAT